MPDLRAWFVRHRLALGIAVGCVLITLSFVSLEKLTRDISFADVRHAVHTLSITQIVAALALSAGSYLALTFYDVLALRVVGHPQRWRTAAFASFTSYALSHNLGMPLLTGGAVRYRAYAGAGLDGPSIAKVIGIASGAFWAGIVTVAAVAAAFDATPFVVIGHALGVTGLRGLGIAVLLLGVATVWISGRVRQPVLVLDFELPVPRPGQSVALIGVAVLDVLFSSAALLVLIPHLSPSLLPLFLLAYACAIAAAVVAHVPGGIGVFEAAMLALLPIDRAPLFAALIAYRVIYYLLPLAIGIAMLAWSEGRRVRSSLRLLGEARDVASGLAPIVLSAATFVGGGMLLLSGSLPALRDRMGVLSSLLPLPFIEASHVAASLVGTALLLLSPVLYRRLDGAFVATRALLIAGAVFSLAKGIDYEEAIICLTLAGLLQWTRHGFYRRTTMTSQPFGFTWFGSVATVIGLATWAGFFAYRKIPYSNDLWWQFTLDADAPRFLRGLLGVSIVLGIGVGWKLLAPTAVGRLDAVPLDDLAAARTVLDQAVRSDAMLALTGDKRFILSADRDAFLMYQVQGATWIVMGDPVGPRGAWDDLLWQIRDLVDREQGRLVLYEISPPTLDLALSMGLSVVKYGEEALVHLPGFSLDRPCLRGIRRSERTLVKKGAQFRIVPAAELAEILPELSIISDDWLRAKGQQEKGFSLGRFDAAYLGNFDVGVVELSGRLIAFANIWAIPNKAEISIDLMRHRDDAPSGTMDFLFANLMLWARDQHYTSFSLGVAPLSGIEDRRLAPAWARIAAFIFRHGERFYGFRGLRAYKDKFAPAWEPRYIAGPHGIALLQAMRDLLSLVGSPVNPATPSRFPG